MKKYFYSVLAASMLFACSQEEIVDVNKSESQLKTFKVELPANVTSRAAGGAIGAGTQADQLIYAMYEHGVENAPVLVSGIETDGEDNDGTFTVTVPMAKDIKYDLLFLAYNPSYPAFEIASTPDSTNLKALKFNAGQTPNVDAYDAFVGFLANNGVNETKTVTLKRPFAQINAATTSQDLQDAARLEATVKQSKLVITGVPTTYNVLSEEATGSQEVTYAPTDILNNETITVDGTTYTYLTLAYVLAGEGSSNHEATFEFFRENDNNPVSTLIIPNLPIQRNYRTNVVGSLVTKQGKYTISIAPAFEGTNVMDLWDGYTVKEPAYNETTNQYEISHASQLAWLAAAVNGTLTEENSRSAVAANNFAGKTFVLTDDVDLLDNEWTPIGTKDNIFKGTFDGNGKTIKNLKITGYNSNVGLFGVTHDGEIKNFTVENAKVSGRLNVGVVAGQPYTSKYTDITVTGHVEVNGMAYVGGVGGKNAYADWTNITVNADETSYVKAHSIENETAYRTYVGGVVGFNGEGGHKFSDITSNIKVQGSTCDVGGLFGIAHYGNQFTNCVCTGDVEIYAAEEAEEAQEIGGIAGVWHNGGENVVLTNCSFSGNLSTNIEGINFYYDGLVGKPYATTGNGKLIITGREMLANGVALKDGVYFVYNADGLRWIASTVNAGKNFSNATIKLEKDINLSGAEWMPIGYGNNRFSGNFDGQNHTISGMTITEYNGKPQAALFGNIALTTSFKNLTIDEAEVVMPADHTGDFYAAGLIGTYYGSVTIENVTVKNSTFSGNNKVAAIIAHDGVGSNLTIKDTHVLECNISSTNLTDGGNVGGMIGLFQSVPNGVYYISESSVENCTITGVNSSNSGKRANGEFVACVNSKEGQTLVIENCDVEGNEFSQTIDGTNPVTYVGPYDNKFVGGERNDATDLPGIVKINGNQYPALPVAKIGNTEYKSIDEAIANWTNGTTLTLIDDVTLTDVITLKSTEHHILNLGTFTMTAASKKNAIEITPNGAGTAAKSCLTINADATNPGSIEAGSKACIYYTKTDGSNDRLMVTINGGIFNGTISSSSNNGGQACPYFVFNGGVFNKSINLTKAMLKVTGGTFHNMFSCTGDQTAYRLISGGTFKSFTFMTADAPTKFVIGTAKEVYNVGLYVNDEGYLVVGGPVITEFGDKFAAKATNPTKWSSYLKYSSAAEHGLYYTNAELAVKKHGAANVELK